MDAQSSDYSTTSAGLGLRQHHPYERAVVPPAWARRYAPHSPALQARASGSETILTGPLPDRAALHGVLAEIEALGLELLEVRRLPPV
jgi:hypothetical protein